jgi:hypothetical protein
MGGHGVFILVQIAYDLCISGFAGNVPFVASALQDKGVLFFCGWQPQV